MIMEDDSKFVEKPLVSVLMTAYNREKYIAEAIDSLLQSTYPNWELIILDDCSTDDTLHIAKTYKAKDSRIKVFKNPKNLGQFKNRNRIVDYANGKYLKYLDSDDLIYPYGLEQLVYYMENNPMADYGFCSIQQDKERIFPILLSPKEAYEKHFLEKVRIFHKAPLSSIIKKEAFEKMGGFPHEGVSGDFAMWLQLSLQYSVLLMPIGIVWYREHEEQEMQKTRDNVLIEFEYLKVEEYFLKLPDCPLNVEQQKKEIKRVNSDQIRYILWKFRQRGPGIALKLLKMKNQPFTLNRIRD